MPQLEEIFADINREGAIPEVLDDKDKDKEEDKKENTSAEDNGEETTTESQTENDQEDTPPHQGDDDPDDKKENEDDGSDNTDDEEKENLPFHKHPRFKQITDENKLLKQELDELKGGFEELKIKNSKGDTSTEENPPDWFVGIFGEDKEVWKQFEKYDNARLQQLEEKIIQTVSEKEKAKQEEVSKWEKWVDDEVQRLKDAGNEFDKNELIKTAIDYKPTDENGNYNLEKALEILKMKKTSKPSSKDTQKNNARKKIADVSGGTSSDEKTGDSYSTKDLRGLSWNEL